MKHSVLFSFIVFGFLLLISGCNKPVYKYNFDFEGTWRTPVTYDTILDKNVISEIIIDGLDGSFKNSCDPCAVNLCNCISTQVGKAVMNSTKSQMRIGSSSAYPLFIDEEPNIDLNGFWTMKIKGLRYYRQ